MCGTRLRPDRLHPALQRVEKSCARYTGILNKLCYHSPMQIHTLDLHFSGVPNTIAAYLVVGERGIALVETGAMSTLPACLAALDQLGYQPADIQHVLATHIHFDHAGAAGWWAAQGAHVYVHHVGAPHLIDPSRLLASARKVYGDALDTMWGDMLPINPDQLTPLYDGDQVTIGDLHFTAWDTPGHARHHHALLIDDVAFSGDVAGVRLPNSRFIALAGAPPQFDPVAYDASITRLAQANLRRLYLTHFGPVDDVADHLARYREIVWGAAEFVRAHLRNGATAVEIADRYITFMRERAVRDGIDEAVWSKHSVANPPAISAEGVQLYWNRHASNR